MINVKIVSTQLTIQKILNEFEWKRGFAIADAMLNWIQTAENASRDSLKLLETRFSLKPIMKKIVLVSV